MYIDSTIHQRIIKQAVYKFKLSEFIGLVSNELWSETIRSKQGWLLIC